MLLPSDNIIGSEHINTGEKDVAIRRMIHSIFINYCVHVPQPWRGFDAASPPVDEPLLPRATR